MTLSYGPHRLAKKVIIFGSRKFDDYPLLCKKMDYYTQNWWDVWVISGTQKTRLSWNKWCGADYFGEKWALSRRYTVTRFHPDWDAYGKSAGFLRNKEMAEFARGQYGVAFWDGISKGTANMIELCRKFNITLRIVRF